MAAFVVAAPGYFLGNMSLGGLTMAAGAFNQVQQARRWFLDNFSTIADWRATLLRVANFRLALIEMDKLGSETGHIRTGIVAAILACGLACGSLAKGMTKISYKGYRFPPEIIQQAIWLYLRFTLSFRDVEDLLAERGIMVSYETVRRWVNHFGPMIAADLRKRRPKPHTTWHLDEVYLKIDGRMVYLWRAVDAEGEVLDVLVQAKRNKRAALKLMRKLLKKYGFRRRLLVTDDLRSSTPLRANLGSRIGIAPADRPMAKQ